MLGNRRGGDGEQSGEWGLGGRCWAGEEGIG